MRRSYNNNRNPARRHKEQQQEQHQHQSPTWEHATHQNVFYDDDGDDDSSSPVASTNTTTRSPVPKSNKSNKAVNNNNNNNRRQTKAQDNVATPTVAPRAGGGGHAAATTSPAHVDPAEQLQSLFASMSPEQQQALMSNLQAQQLQQRADQLRREAEELQLQAAALQQQQQPPRQQEQQHPNNDDEKDDDDKPQQETVARPKSGRGDHQRQQGTSSRSAQPQQQKQGPSTMKLDKRTRSNLISFIMKPRMKDIYREWNALDTLSEEIKSKKTHSEIKEIVNNINNKKQQDHHVAVNYDKWTYLYEIHERVKNLTGRSFRDEEAKIISELEEIRHARRVIFGLVVAAHDDDDRGSATQEQEEEKKEEKQITPPSASAASAPSLAVPLPKTSSAVVAAATIQQQQQEQKEQKQQRQQQQQQPPPININVSKEDPWLFFRKNAIELYSSDEMKTVRATFNKIATRQNELRKQGVLPEGDDDDEDDGNDNDNEETFNLVRGVADLQKRYIDKILARGMQLRDKKLFLKHYAISIEKYWITRFELKSAQHQEAQLQEQKRLERQQREEATSRGKQRPKKNNDTTASCPSPVVKNNNNNGSSSAISTDPWSHFGSQQSKFRSCMEMKHLQKLFDQIKAKQQQQQQQSSNMQVQNFNLLNEVEKLKKRYDELSVKKKSFDGQRKFLRKFMQSIEDQYLCKLHDDQLFTNVDDEEKITELKRFIQQPQCQELHDLWSRVNKAQVVVLIEKGRMDLKQIANYDKWEFVARARKLLQPNSSQVERTKSSGAKQSKGNNNTNNQTTDEMKSLREELNRLLEQVEPIATTQHQQDQQQQQQYQTQQQQYQTQDEEIRWLDTDEKSDFSQEADSSGDSNNLRNDIRRLSARLPRRDERHCIRILSHTMLSNNNDDEKDQHNKKGRRHQNLPRYFFTEEDKFGYEFRQSLFRVESLPDIVCLFGVIGYPCTHVDDDGKPVMKNEKPFFDFMDQLGYYSVFVPQGGKIAGVHLFYLKKIYQLKTLRREDVDFVMDYSSNAIHVPLIHKQFNKLVNVACVYHRYDEQTDSDDEAMSNFKSMMNKLMRSMKSTILVCDLGGTQDELWGNRSHFLLVHPSYQPVMTSEDLVPNTVTFSKIPYFDPARSVLLTQERIERQRAIKQK